MKHKMNLISLLIRFFFSGKSSIVEGNPQQKPPNRIDAGATSECRSKSRSHNRRRHFFLLV
ncbi:hypothetical protein Hanom_Chr01g00071841 [Helianthus anomalus]